MNSPCFIAFKNSIHSLDLPTQFTFPFHYQPAEIAKMAAAQLQEYLETQKDFDHNFDINSDSQIPAIGKMFGVLVVRNEEGEIGFLAAFSGKLANSNTHSLFVPPVFDILKKDGFYKIGEELNNETTRKIELLESSDSYKRIKAAYTSENNNIEDELIAMKERLKQKKIRRQESRLALDVNLDTHFVSEELSKLNAESRADQFELKDVIKQHNKRRSEAKIKMDTFLKDISKLKLKRKERSIQLQRQLFESYTFLNADGQTKSLLELFETTLDKMPPSAAGECAAPKLMQYAYLQNLQPIALAEFWWGDAPNSQIRKHQHYYPACKSKCLPILSHMLVGLDVEDNLLEKDFSSEKKIEVIYEDEVIMAINKPAEFLSVPGKTITDSVLQRVRYMLPNATGPLLLHRIDMSTSGILLVAKNEQAHTFLQNQFENRIIKKRYVALLDGWLNETNGEVELPLRVDLDNRPQQLVCYEHGKPAKTQWKTIQRVGSQTKVYFYPITGRTHQLRVHAAHKLGLNTPIVGDDLYGTADKRLYLHAESIKFIHPTTNEWMKLKAKCEF